MESEGLAKQVSFNRLRGKESGKSSDAGWRCVWATVLEGSAGVYWERWTRDKGRFIVSTFRYRQVLPLLKEDCSNSHIQLLPLLLFQLCWRGVEMMPAWGMCS